MPTHTRARIVSREFTAALWVGRTCMYVRPFFRESPASAGFLRVRCHRSQFAHDKLRSLLTALTSPACLDTCKRERADGPVRIHRNRRRVRRIPQRCGNFQRPLKRPDDERPLLRFVMQQFPDYRRTNLRNKHVTRDDDVSDHNIDSSSKMVILFRTVCAGIECARHTVY